MRLLQAVQKDLLLSSSIETDTASSSSSSPLSASGPKKEGGETPNAPVEQLTLPGPLKVLLYYSQSLFNKGTEVLGKVIQIHNTFTGDEEDASPQQQPALRKRKHALDKTLAERLRASFFGSLLPSLVVSICLLPHKHLWAHRLTRQVLDLLAALDTLNKLLPHTHILRSATKKEELKHPQQQQQPQQQQWLLYLEKSVAHLGGMLVGAAIAGDTVNAEETKFNKWLESKLLSRGLEDSCLVIIFIAIFSFYSNDLFPYRDLWERRRQKKKLCRNSCNRL